MNWKTYTSDPMLKTLFENENGGVYETPTGRILYTNFKFCKLYGHVRYFKEITPYCARADYVCASFADPVVLSYFILYS